MTDGAAHPEVAVIVLSYGPRATLPAAVRSVMAQDIGTELIVVHSGGGDVRSLLEAEGLDVPVAEFSERLYVGAARNVGIERTTAPIVAFLADDCTAEAGWIRARRDAHEAGHPAVASALVPHRPLHPTTLAIHLTLHVLRMPTMPSKYALRYGVSYSRDVLTAVGPFDGSLPDGEDTAYHARFVEHGISIHWDPQVVTVHRGLERLRDALPDGYRRGYRRALLLAAQGRPRLRFVRRIRERAQHARRWLPYVVTGDQRRALLVGLPVYILCVVAITLGEWRAGWRSRA